MKGEGKAADNIIGGPEHSTLSNDAFPSREFDFILSNQPTAKAEEIRADILALEKEEGLLDEILGKGSLFLKGLKRPKGPEGRALSRLSLVSLEALTSLILWS